MWNLYQLYKKWKKKEGVVKVTLPFKKAALVKDDTVPYEMYDLYDMHSLQWLGRFSTKRSAFSFGKDYGYIIYD